MPGTPSRTRPAAERRRDLLDAGLAAFLERGVAATTLDQITQRAGIAKGSFYLHFESKEQLLAALQIDFESAMVTRIDAAVAAVGDLPGALDVWVTAALADYPAERALHDVLFHHPLLADHQRPPAAERSRDLVDSLTDLLEAGLTAGAFHLDDPPVTAMLLCSALHRAFDRIWHRDEALDPHRLAAAVQALFRRAVGLADAV